MEPLPSRCLRCEVPKAPVTCAKCKTVLYCSERHKVDDAVRHHGECKAIVDGRKKLKQEETKLKRMRGDMFMPDNVFEEGEGDFWLIHETRPYMRAKYALIDALVAVESRPAIAASLEEAVDALRLDQQDHQGIREFPPALFLLLGKVQEAYDYIKIWAVYGCEGDEENDGDEDEDEEEDEDMEDEDDEEPSVAPCFKPRRFDMTEDVSMFEKPMVSSIFHLLALAYIKMTLAYSVNGAIKMMANDAVDKMELIAFLEAKKLPTEIAALQTLAEKLTQQADQAALMVHTRSSIAWRGVADPTTIYNAPRSIFLERGNASEILPWIKPYAALWRATPFALHFATEKAKLATP